MFVASSGSLWPTLHHSITLQTLPALGAAISDLMAGRATSLPFELSADMVAAAAAGLAPDSAAAAAVAAAADMLRRNSCATSSTLQTLTAAGSGSAGGAPIVSGLARRPSLSCDASNDPNNAPFLLQDLTLLPLGGAGGAVGSGTTGPVAVASSGSGSGSPTPPAGAAAGVEIFPVGDPFEN